MHKTKRVIKLQVLLCLKQGIEGNLSAPVELNIRSLQNTDGIKLSSS